MRGSYTVVYLQKVLTLFLFLILLHSVSNAQIPLARPDGEDMYSNVLQDSYLDFDATTVYLEHESGWTGVDLWEAPKGYTILDASFKLFSHDIVLLVLDPLGLVEVMTMKFNGLIYEDPVYKGFITPMQFSEGFTRIGGDALYAVSSSGIYVSRDTGKTWSPDTAGLSGSYPGFSKNNIAVDSAQNVWFATSKGIFKQLPAGGSWQHVDSLSASSATSVFIDRKNRFFASTNSGVYMSTNRGVSWTRDTIGMGTTQISSWGDDVYGNVYAVNSPAIYRSSGGTGSWTRIDGSLTTLTGSSVAIHSIAGDTTILVGTTFGLYRSSNQGGSWTETNNGIHASRFYTFVKSQNGNWFTATDLGIFTKTPSATTWQKNYPSAGYQSSLPLVSDGAGNVYTAPSSTIAGGPIVYKSTDNGTTWNVDTAGVSLTRTGVFYIDEQGGQHLATSQYGSSFPTLIYTKPVGGSWTLDTAGFTSSNYSFASSLSSDKHGNLYITGYYYNGSVQVNGRVMRRPLSGGSWVVDTNGLGSLNYLSNLGPDKSGNMMGEAGSTLYRHSAAGGWNKVSLPSQAVTNFYSPSKFSVDSSGALFVSFTNFSGGHGVYFSTDGGTSWTFAGLDSVGINRLISYGDSTYASTSNGLYILRRQAAGTTGVTTATMAPKTFALYQNYPNPFNPTTTIQFSIGKLSIVNLKIFDLLGREVETLVNGAMEAGEHQVKFDAARFASGIYFYRLQAGSFTETKKLILLK